MRAPKYFTLHKIAVFNLRWTNSGHLSVVPVQTFTGQTIQQHKWTFCCICHCLRHITFTGFISLPKAFFTVIVRPCTIQASFHCIRPFSLYYYDCYKAPYYTGLISLPKAFFTVAVRSYTGFISLPKAFFIVIVRPNIIQASFHCLRPFSLWLKAPYYTGFVLLPFSQ